MNEQILSGRPTFPAQLNMSHPLTVGLIGCWLLNDTGGIRVWDSSPCKDFGTLVNAFPSRSFNGLLFNGSNNQVKLTRVDLTLTNGVSVVAWANHNNIGAGNERLFSKNNAGLNPFDLFMEGASIRYDFVVNATTVTTQTSSIASRQWHMAVGTYDYTLLKAYLDGTLRASAALSAAIQVSTSAASIGANPDLSAPLNGMINYVLLYNRALTANEVKRLYLSPYEMFLKDA